MAVTVGLLGFLAVDATLEGLDVAGTGSQALGGPSLVFLGAAVSYLLLMGVQSWLTTRTGRAKGSSAAPAAAGTVAVLVALAIGLHNLGEGLAIGSAYAVGALSLGAFLVIGFALHNTTEGLAIVAPVASDPPPLRRLVLLGALAGAPAILGAWIGASAFNSSLAAFLLGAGCRGDRPGDPAAGAIDPRPRRPHTPPARRRRHPGRDRDPLPDQPSGERRDEPGGAAQRGDRGLREGDLRPRAAQRRSRDDDRAGRAAGRDARLGVGDGEAARRARLRDARALPRRPADRQGPRRGARGAAPSPAAGAISGRVARRALGPGARRSRGAGARPLGGARGADRGEARQSHPRPPRRSDSRPGS